MKENIWALDKEMEIKHLLLMLVAAFGTESIDIRDQRDGDPRAITLCKADEPEIQAYVYRHGQAPNRFGVHLAFPQLDAINLSDTEIIHENLAWDRLTEMLGAHFDVVAPQVGAR